MPKTGLFCTLFFLLTASFTHAQSKEKLCFITVDFDKIKAYLYDGSAMQLIVETGVLDSSVIDTAGYTLTKQQIRKLDWLLADTTNIDFESKTETIINGRKKSFYDSFICDQAFCFMPHHGLVFYRQNKIVGHISVCFGCNQVSIHSVCEGSVYCSKEHNICVTKLRRLFDEFRLTVGGQFYKCEDFHAIHEAIVNANIKQYGKDYVSMRQKRKR